MTTCSQEPKEGEEWLDPWWGFAHGATAWGDECDYCKLHFLVYLQTGRQLFLLTPGSEFKCGHSRPPNIIRSSYLASNNAHSWHSRSFLTPSISVSNRKWCKWCAQRYTFLSSHLHHWVGPWLATFWYLSLNTTELYSYISAWEIPIVLDNYDIYSGAISPCWWGTTGSRSISIID